MTCTSCYNARLLDDLESSLFIRDTISKKDFFRFTLSKDRSKYIYIRVDFLRLNENNLPNYIIVTHEPIKNYSVNEIINMRFDDNFLRNYHRVSPIAIRELTNDEERWGTDYLTNHLKIDQSFKDSSEDYYWIFNKTLHVHHKYYNLSKYPWDYPNEALITLCSECHKDIHANNRIPLMSNFGKQICLLDRCETCFGTGTRPEYNYYMGGICFTCGGSGIANIDKYL